MGPDSYPNFFSNLVSNSQSYSNLKFDSPLHNPAGSQISPLHFTAGRFLQKSLTWLPVVLCSGEIWLPAASCGGEIRLPAAWCSGEIWLQHYAAGSQPSIQITLPLWNQIWQKLRKWISVQGGYFWWKKRRWKISRYCPFKGGKRSFYIGVRRKVGETMSLQISQTWNYF